jgi:hypothetical protein
MLPGIAPMIVKPPGGGNDSFTKLLLHFDGNATDSSLTARGTGTMGGSVTFSTTTKKFGTHAAQWGASGSFTFTNHADFDFGAGDFTVDWWEYRTAKAASQPVFARSYPVTYSPFLIWSSATDVVFHSSTNSTSWNAAPGNIVGSMDNNVWNHFAIARSGNTLYFFKNGVLTSTYPFNFTLPAWGQNPVLGAALNGPYIFVGYMDEFRWSKGIARWTANFSPPTAPYS